jgi:hypothetical protein
MELQRWLEQHGCQDVVPVEVTIKGTTYLGCRYQQARRHTPGTRAFREGLRTYTQEAIYLLGKLPAVYVRSSRVVFVVEGDDREWFVASWVTQEVARSGEYAHAHFNGEATFQMMPSVHEGSLDEHEERPYARIPAVIVAAREPVLS